MAINISQDKSEILDLIGTYTSIGKYKKRKKRNSVDSNNDKDIIPFLLDILTVIIGSVTLYRVFGDIVTNVIRQSNPVIGSSIKTNLLSFNSSDNIPGWFIQDGLTIPISRIDVFKILKNNPNSSVGSLYYNAGDFNSIVFSSFSTPNTPVTFNNITITYNSASDTITVKPIATTTIEGFFNDYLNNNIINDKGIASFSLDNIFGTLSKLSNKTRSELLLDEKNLLFLQKYLNENEDIEITSNEYYSLEKKSESIYSGSDNIDIGCGFVNLTLPLNTLTGLTETIKNSDNSEEIGNEVDGMIDDLFSDIDTSEFGGTNAAKDSFFKRLIYFLQLNLLKESILSPQVKLAMILSYSFKNNGLINNDTDSDFTEFKNLIKCIVLEIKGLLHEFLYNLIQTELQNILIEIQKKIINEKYESYIRILKSLI